MNNYKNYKVMLQAHPQRVVFEKKDGTTRIMRCTLDPEFIKSVADFSEQEKKRNTNENVIAVWDLEVAEWRSFRVDSVQSINNLTGDELMEILEEGCAASS